MDRAKELLVFLNVERFRGKVGASKVRPDFLGKLIELTKGYVPSLIGRLVFTENAEQF